MPDTNTDEGGDANVEGQDETSNVDDNAGGEGGADDNQDDAGDGDGGGDEGDEDDAADDGEEPGSRKGKTAKDHIIARKERQRKRAEKKAKESEDDEDDADEGDEDINDEDEAIVSKIVEKKIAPVLEAHQEAQDAQEVTDFLTENPEFKKYEAKVKRFMKHPSRKDIPASSIFYEVAGPDLMKIGAKRAKAADAKAKNTSSGGGSSKGIEGGKAIKDMSSEEFRTAQNKVRMRR